MLKLLRRMITNPFHPSSLAMYILLFIPAVILVGMLSTTEFGQNLFAELDIPLIKDSLELITEYLNGPELYKYSQANFVTMLIVFLNLVLDNVFDALLIGFSVFLVKTFYVRYTKSFFQGKKGFAWIPAWADLIGIIIGCVIVSLLDNPLNGIKIWLRPTITIAFLLIGIYIMLFKARPHWRDNSHRSLINELIIKLIFIALSGIPSAICVTLIVLIIYQMPQCINGGASTIVVLINGALGIAACWIVRSLFSLLFSQK